MSPLEEVLGFAWERELALIVHPVEGGVCAALVGDDDAPSDHAACGPDLDAAIDALVRLLRYQQAEFEVTP